MKALKSKISGLGVKAHTRIISLHGKAKRKLFDTSGEGHVDVAVKIIIGVVIGALVLAGLVALWNSVIMPRLNSEINTMFG